MSANQHPVDRLHDLKAEIAALEAEHETIRQRIIAGEVEPRGTEYEATVTEQQKRFVSVTEAERLLPPALFAPGRAHDRAAARNPAPDRREKAAGKGAGASQEGMARIRPPDPASQPMIARTHPPEQRHESRTELRETLLTLVEHRRRSMDGARLAHWRTYHRAGGAA